MTGVLRTTHRTKAAGLTLALLACVAMLLTGVLRLTHRHDDAGAHGVQAALQHSDHDECGEHGHSDHQEADCTICLALAANTSALADISVARPLTPNAIGSRAESTDYASASADRRAAWWGRAPPLA
jgi:hypothetical protein